MVPQHAPAVHVRLVAPAVPVRPSPSCAATPSSPSVHSCTPAASMLHGGPLLQHAHPACTPVRLLSLHALVCPTGLGRLHAHVHWQHDRHHDHIMCDGVDLHTHACTCCDCTDRCNCQSCMLGRSRCWLCNRPACAGSLPHLGSARGAAQRGWRAIASGPRKQGADAGAERRGSVWTAGETPATPSAGRAGDLAPARPRGTSDAGSAAAGGAAGGGVSGRRRRARGRMRQDAPTPGPRSRAARGGRGVGPGAAGQARRRQDGAGCVAKGSRAKATHLAAGGLPGAPGLRWTGAPRAAAWRLAARSRTRVARRHALGRAASVAAAREG